MLELGIAGGRAVPLQKRTVGNTNISDVFDGVNHIWPTRDDVAYFYDFNSIQLRFIWTDSNGRDFDTGTNITNAPSIPSEIVGWSWGSSENRTQPFLYWGGDNTQSGAECVMVDIKSIYNDSISTAFRYGYVAGNSEKRGQQFIRSYVSSRDGQAADEEFAVVNYFDKTEAGQVVALNPIT